MTASGQNIVKKSGRWRCKFISHPPIEMYERISDLARELIEDARSDLGPGEPVDHHVHVGGVGTDVSKICPEIRSPGVWIHPDFRSWRHPIRWLEARLLLGACGVCDWSDADTQYAERLLDLVRASRLGGTYFLYALDWRYERPPNNRTPNREKTDLYVDDEYVIALARWLNAQENGGARFVPVASVHPYRPNAIEALAALSARGVRHIKWLPPAQNIDPADSLLKPFYRAMHQLNFILMSHTGDEHTLRVRDRDQDLADPLRLSLALDQGATVVMLHAGRDGIERSPGTDGQRRSYADRFFAMMKRYPWNLFGEISAIPYLGTHSLLESLMADPEICGRLVNGSDYPAPAIPAIDPTERLLCAGYFSDEGTRDKQLARKRMNALREIRRYNPLLFDFVLKRTLRLKGRKLPRLVFQGISSKLKLIEGAKPRTSR
jgi:mannonate dehydratase